MLARMGLGPCSVHARMVTVWMQACMVDGCCVERFEALCNQIWLWRCVTACAVTSLTCNLPATPDLSAATEPIGPPGLLPIGAPIIGLGGNPPGGNPPIGLGKGPPGPVYVWMFTN